MAERNFSAQLAGKFVDDDDLIRTGRAWLEIDGFDFLHIPVPKGFENTLDVFETQADQVAKDVETTGKYASAAKSSASAAASSASKAASSETAVNRNVSAAKDSATRAETAAGNAKTSETNAEDAARRASNSSTSANRSSVWVSEAEQRTKKSASEAANSATQAADSATSAKQEADRAAGTLDSMFWNGDRLAVHDKISPHLTGPKGADGTVSFDALTPEQKAQLKGAPGEVSKAQLDAAVAAEKARTVGMTWTVETEDQAKTKETSCQKGDFIQVAQTGNIYQVV